MKCPSCEHEIDDLAVAQYASEQLQMFDFDEAREELYLDGYRNMGDGAEAREWLRENASDYDYADTSDREVLLEIVEDHAESFGYVHERDIPEEVPDDVQRELWRLGLVACTETPTWDHVAEMLRGFR